MWFDSWDDVVRIVLVGAASYTALVILLRLAGKRTLSQLNAFDFVVTVALGSILASVLLDSTLSFTEGMTALALLGGSAVQHGLHLIPVAQNPKYHHRRSGVVAGQRSDQA